MKHFLSITNIQSSQIKEIKKNLIFSFGLFTFYYSILSIKYFSKIISQISNKNGYQAFPIFILTLFFFMIFEINYKSQNHIRKNKEKNISSPPSRKVIEFFLMYSKCHQMR